MTDTTTPTPDTTSTQPAARVTKEDVLLALGDTDPNRTNASALRAILGRGGNTTIQKILEEIRAERAAPLPTFDTELVPPPPAALAEFFDSVTTSLRVSAWPAAWAHAQALTFGKLDLSTAELERLKNEFAVLHQDKIGADTEIDELRDALAQQIESEGVKLDAVGERVQQLEGELALAHVELAALKQQLEQAAALAQRDIEQARRDAAQAAALAQRDAELKDAAHQRDRDRLMDQVAELKALLYRPAPTAPTAKKAV